MPVSAVLVSAALLAAIEPAMFNSSGDAIAAEPMFMNLLLLKFWIVSLTIISPLRTERISHNNFIRFSCQTSLNYWLKVSPCPIIPAHRHDELLKIFWNPGSADWFGKPILRLVEAGARGSNWGDHYGPFGGNAGVSVLAGGRIAGKKAAAERPWS
jgi:hypothetical protein